MEKKNDIFISYCRANLDQVKAIKAEIEQQTGSSAETAKWFRKAAEQVEKC